MEDEQNRPVVSVQSAKPQEQSLEFSALCLLILVLKLHRVLQLMVLQQMPMIVHVVRLIAMPLLDVFVRLPLMLVTKHRVLHYFFLLLDQQPNPVDWVNIPSSVQIPEVNRRINLVVGTCIGIQADIGTLVKL